MSTICGVVVVVVLAAMIYIYPQMTAEVMWLSNGNEGKSLEENCVIGRLVLSAELRPQSHCRAVWYGRCGKMPQLRSS